MYIFSRTGSLDRNHLADGMASSVQIAAKVAQVTGREVRVFNVRYGQPYGTVMFSVRAESFAENAEMWEKLATDQGYLDMASSISSKFSTLPTDRALSILVASPDVAGRHLYATTTATAANGKMAEAVAFGARAQGVVAAAGFPSWFGASAFGAFGEMMWATGLDTAADVDRFQTFMSTDPGMQQIVAEAGDLFIPGSGQNGLLERIN
jgi:hypothetical protein